MWAPEVTGAELLSGGEAATVIAGDVNFVDAAEGRLCSSPAVRREGRRSGVEHGGMRRRDGVGVAGARRRPALGVGDASEGVAGAGAGGVSLLALPLDLCACPRGAPQRRGDASWRDDALCRIADEAALVERDVVGCHLGHEGEMADRLRTIATEAMLVERRRDVRAAPSEKAKRTAKARWARRLSAWNPQPRTTAPFSIAGAGGKTI